MELRYSSSATQQARARTAAEMGFDVVERRRTIVISPGSTTGRVDRDSAYLDSVGATVDSVGDVDAVSVLAGMGVQYDNLDPTVATFDELGDCVARLANGTCRVNVTARGATRQIGVAISRQTPTTATQFTGYAAGTFGRACSDYVDGRIASLTAGTTTKNRFSTGTTPNPSNFAADADTSCVSIEQWRLTAVSPLHAISSAHAGAAVGDLYQWRGTDGTLHARTIVAATTLPGYVNSSYATYHLDLRVYRLSAALPAVVTPGQVLPANRRTTYAPGLANGIPAIGFNGDRNFVTEFHDDANSTHQTPAEMAAFKRSTFSAKRSEFFEAFSYSSNPVLLIRASGAPPIVATLESFSNSTGPDLVKRASEINGIMTAQGGGHQLTIADLSGFAAY